MNNSIFIAALILYSILGISLLRMSHCITELTKRVNDLEEKWVVDDSFDGTMPGAIGMLVISQNKSVDAKYLQNHIDEAQTRTYNLANTLGYEYQPESNEKKDAHFEKIKG